MKKILKVFVCFTFILLITSGCSDNSNQPDNDLIKNDLETSLTEYKEFLFLDDYKIDKSKTEEKTFTATIDVTANGQYATHSLVAEVSYTRYDQGWQMDTCDWSNLEFIITNYPQPEEIMKWNNYIDKDVTIENIDGDNDILNIHRVINTDVTKYIHISEKEIENYNYNSEIGLWEYSRTEDIEDLITVDKEIEGTYYSIDNSYVIQISEVNEGTFKYSFKGVEQNKWQIEDIFKPSGWNFEENQYSFRNDKESLYNLYEISFASQLSIEGRNYDNVCIINSFPVGTISSGSFEHYVVLE